MGHFDPADWQREKPFTGGRNEMSFLGNFILTVLVLLVGAIAFRYQTEILRFLNGPTVAAPQRTAIHPPGPAVIPPKVNLPEKSQTESSGQIYRCRNTYSNSPCDGSQEFIQQRSRPVDRTETREIYLCKDFQDRLTWESVPCSTNGRFMDRIARVPANIPWDEQVSIARQQRDKAHAIAAEQVVPVPTRSINSEPSACRFLEERINALDAECRVNACGMDQLDRVRFERKKVRDQQFRIRC